LQKKPLCYNEIKNNSKKGMIMRKTIYFIFVLFIFIGCAAVRDIKDDYLGGAKDPIPLSDAKITFKENYLRADRPAFNAQTTRRFIYMAQEKILTIAQYKEDFDLLSATIDQEPMMPEGFSYAFIHIKPKQEKISQYGNKTYLVVIALLGERIVYADIFEPPSADPFYRYKRIVDLIGQNR